MNLQNSCYTIEPFPETQKEESDHLLNWIYAQTTKIIFRYYDPNSLRNNKKHLKENELSLFDELVEFIKNDVPQERRQYFLDNLVYLSGVFYGKLPEAPLTPALVPRLIGAKVFELALRKGYSFIVVLDGLDRLETTPYFREKFNKLIGLTHHLITTPENIGMIILPVTRTNTLRTVLPQNAPYKPNSVKRYMLENISINEVIEKRVEYLKKEVKAIAIKENDESNWPVADWPVHIDKFIVYLDEKIGDGKTIFYKTLIDFFAENRRAQMQTVQLGYMDYIKKFREKLYRLTECLCKAGTLFPVKPYMYYKHKGVMVRECTREHLFDYHLLPSIFLFPYLAFNGNSKHDNIPDIPSLSGLLLGLRILQILDAHERRYEITKKGGKSIDRLKSREVSEILNTLWGIERELVENLIEEFAEYELISVGGDEEFPIAVNRTMHLIYPLPRMKYMLKNILYDVAYLNMCSMRIPLSEKALTHDIPYFVANTFETHGSRGKLIEWIGVEITNTIGLLRLIEALNKIHSDKYKENSSRLSDRQKETINLAVAGISEDEGMFTVMEKLKKSIMYTLLKGILPSVEHGLPMLYSRLKAYHDKWQNL